MANLTWFAYDVAWWDERVRAFGLSFEEEGILMRLVRGAWESTVPCTIANTDDEFARLLGARWKRGLAMVERHFTPDPENPGRLRCDWLSALYASALAKHESYQSRGKLGGRPPGRKAPRHAPGHAPEKAQHKAEPKAEVSQSSTDQSDQAEGCSCGPSDHTATTPAPPGARALEGARAPSAMVAAERPTRAGEIIDSFGDQWRTLLAHPRSPYRTSSDGDHVS